MTFDVLLGALLIYLAGIGTGIYLARKWLLQRERGSHPGRNRKKTNDLRVALVDLYGHEKWIYLPLDVEQHKSLARHIIRSPGRGAAKLTYQALTPASSKVMSRAQLTQVRRVLIAREMVIFNSRTLTMTPLPSLGVWAAGVLRWAARMEQQT